jgi:hypothetical protein
MLRSNQTLLTSYQILTNKECLPRSLHHRGNFFIHRYGKDVAMAFVAIYTGGPSTRSPEKTDLCRRQSRSQECKRGKINGVHNKVVSVKDPSIPERELQVLM